MLLVKCVYNINRNVALKYI